MLESVIIVWIYAALVVPPSGKARRNIAIVDYATKLTLSPFIMMNKLI